MNKLLSLAVIAGGLLLLDSPEAAASNQAHSQRHTTIHYSSDGYSHVTHRRDRRHHDRRRHARRDYYRHNYHGSYHGSKYKRAKRVPRWLRHERSFRRWYRHSPLRYNRYISWNRLFNIYHAERRYYRY